MRPGRPTQTPPPKTLADIPTPHAQNLTKPVTLDRLFSKLGLASRRTAQEWISAGRVSVNHRVVRTADTWVQWPGDHVLLDERPIQQSTQRFILFHKPKGVVATHQDEQGRKTIFDVLPPELKSLHAVGRLDQATSGLLLLTNDTALSSYLTDPTNKVPRRYLVTVRGEVTEATRLDSIAGLTDEGDLLQCESVTIQKSSGRESHLDVTLTEGKNREIRRLFKALGHEVIRLRRIQYGPFLLDDLSPGDWWELPIEEAKTMLQVKGATIRTLRNEA